MTRMRSVHAGAKSSKICGLSPQPWMRISARPNPPQSRHWGQTTLRTSACRQVKRTSAPNVAAIRRARFVHMVCTYLRG
jgi:hypothetical protein